MNPIKLVKFAFAGWLPFGSRYCAICEHAVWRFMPYGKGSAGVPKLMAALDVVGSDADHFECPHCGAHDRERHLLMYLDASGARKGMRGKSILYFAPEKRLTPRILAAGPQRVVRCDLYPQAADVVRVDMLDMQFEDESFDWVIANHVLEHVADDTQALREIHRVLKPGGRAILQTPYSRKLHDTWQDPGIVDDAARLQAYGQEDHARLYGRDIFERFSAAGLTPTLHTHADLLGQYEAARYGVNPDEPFMLFERA